MGLSALADGAFYPFWADSRTGTFQAWGARVRVAEGWVADEAAPHKAGGATDLSLQLTVIADPARYDAGSGELVMPLQLENGGSSSAAPPLRVEVLGFGSGMGTDLTDLAPVILNASNGRDGTGAVYDYSSALGDPCSSQEPGPPRSNGDSA